MESTTTDWVRAWLGATRDCQSAETPLLRVGELELAAHQSRAVDRGLKIARSYGGVLIADAVGLGKTRVGLGIGRELLRDERRLAGDGVSRKAWVCAPARLRADWQEGLVSARVDGEVVSHTELSREGTESVAGDPGVVIVDEAHRFRNPSARRSCVLSDLATRAPIVLITATPVCNSVWDLYHLLSLFMAEGDVRPVLGFDLDEGFRRAENGEWDLAELLERVAIRRRNIEGWSNRPTVRLEKLTYTPDSAELWVWRHLDSELRSLSLEAFGDEWPKGLFIEHVRKRWESAPQAARRTLKRVCLFHRRWLQAADRGHRLGRSEYKRWYGGCEHQEAMPFALDGTCTDDPDCRNPPSAADICNVRRDLERLGRLLRRIEEVVAGSNGSAEAVGDLAAESGDKMLVFCEYYRTAESYYEQLVDRLGPTGRVGLVTGGEAKATGLGRTTSSELRFRFAPTASGSEFRDAHEQLQILVATDCLAEGVNLQDCGKLVLADMPYSPLRIEQRVGRLVRPGSPHGEVRVYLPEPEEWVETMGLRSRVSRKIDHARQVGSQPAVAASVTVDAESAAGSGDVEGGGDRGWQPVEPMEAVTRLDALYRSIAERDQDPREGTGEPEPGGRQPVWWIEMEADASVSEAMSDVEVVWARWRICVDESDDAPGDQTIWGWARITEDGLDLRRSHLVKPLTAVAQSDRWIRRIEVPGGDMVGWTEPLETWLDQRVATLRSSALAPAPISIEEPQWKLWQRVREAHRTGDIECGRRELEVVKTRLLRSVPQGGRRRFRRWLQSEPEPASILETIREPGTGSSPFAPPDMHRQSTSGEEGVAHRPEILSLLLVRHPPEPPSRLPG